MKTPKTLDKLYIAKDKEGIFCFTDMPDLVKYTTDSIPVWTGYAFDFTDFLELYQYILNNELVKSLKDLDTPLIIKFYKNDIIIEKI